MDTLMQRALRYLGHNPEDFTQPQYDQARQLVQTLHPDLDTMSYEECKYSDVATIILDAVCAEFQVSKEKLLDKTNKRESVNPRSVFWHLFMELSYYGSVKPKYKQPIAYIADLSGHDRCSIYSAHKKVLSDCRIYADWRHIVVPLKQGISKKLATFGLLVKGHE